MSTDIKLRTKDVMLNKEDFPVLFSKTLLKEALEAMNQFHLGIACVVDKKLKLIGVITDGDLRRKLLTVQKPLSAFFADDILIHTISEPVTVNPNTSLVECVQIMGDRHIWDLPVVEKDNTLVGLIHLHPVLKAILALKS